MTNFPQWCLVCAAQAWDNSCGHFPEPLPQCSFFHEGDRCIKPRGHKGQHGTGTFAWMEER